MVDLHITHQLPRLLRSTTQEIDSSLIEYFQRTIWNQKSTHMTSVIPATKTLRISTIYFNVCAIIEGILERISWEICRSKFKNDQIKLHFAKQLQIGYQIKKIQFVNSNHNESLKIAFQIWTLNGTTLC